MATNAGAPVLSGDPRQRAREIEERIGEIEAWPDEAVREMLRDCLQAVLGLYGDGLARIVQLVRNAGPAGEPVLGDLARDDLVRSLLLIHGVHPESLESRLRGALAKVRPYFQSHGGNVELLDLSENGTARLKLLGTCQSCPSSSVTLELAVRQAVEEACPDLVEFSVEGLAPENGASRIPHGPGIAQWRIFENFAGPAEGNMCPLTVDGVGALVCKVHGSFYAYRDRCPGCASPLMAGNLGEGGVLTCPSGHRFDLRRAGVSVDDAGLHLDPFPLLVSHGFLRIAVPP